MSLSGREIINIQLGQCGNQIGNVLLDRILQEHKLDKSGYVTFNYGDDEHDDMLLGKIKSYFHEKGRGELANAYIRQSIESKHNSLSHIPTDIKLLCKRYTGSFIYRARSILIDSDPNILDNIKQSPIKDIFNPKNFIAGSSSFNNNWYVLQHNLLQVTFWLNLKYNAGQKDT